MVSIIATGVLLAIGAAIAFVATRPAEFTIQRSTVIHAPGDTIFHLINTLRAWEEWSPFAQGGEMHITYSGPEGGVGASNAWSSVQMGQGTSTIVESRENECVRLRLCMLKPLSATNIVEFRLSPHAGETQVVWEMKGRNGFVSKAAGLFMDVDRMVGTQFEVGLRQLKRLSEVRTATRAGPPDAVLATIGS